MIGNLPYLPTIGTIAEATNATPEEVSRTIRVLGIHPVARAGMAKVYSLDAVARIQTALCSDGEEGPAK